MVSGKIDLTKSSGSFFSIFDFLKAKEVFSCQMLSRRCYNVLVPTYIGCMAVSCSSELYYFKCDELASEQSSIVTITSTRRMI